MLKLIKVKLGAVKTEKTTNEITEAQFNAFVEGANYALRHLDAQYDGKLNAITLLTVKPTTTIEDVKAMQDDLRKEFQRGYAMVAETVLYFDLKGDYAAELEQLNLLPQA